MSLIEQTKAELISTLPQRCSGPHKFRDFKPLFESSASFMRRRYRDSKGRFAVRACSCDMAMKAPVKTVLERDDYCMKIIAHATYKCDHGENIMYAATKLTDEMILQYVG